MGYKDLTKQFDAVRTQLNIMAIVGNGFDIQVLSDLGSQTDTCYESFYHFLKYRKFNAENRLVLLMEELREHGEENWSDVEAAIGKLISDGTASTSQVATDLRELQAEFSSFLDSVATPEVLTRLGNLSVDQEGAMTSFTEFLGDIQDADEYNSMDLPRRLNIGDLLNFRFINLNYTTLLDDFVYLDQIQFDPHPFRWSDRNLNFHPNPRGHAGALERQDFRMASYLVSEVIHPHGVQNIPRSLLFGVDSADPRSQKLSKPYWAQNEVKYGDLFDQTQLFIIFGCSLGDSDRWWWRKIASALVEIEDAELILYWRRGPKQTAIDEAAIREVFADAVGEGIADDLSTVLEDKVRVVLYDDSTPRAWLNTNPATAPDWKSRSSGVTAIRTAVD